MQKSPDVGSDSTGSDSTVRLLDDQPTSEQRILSPETIVVNPSVTDEVVPFAPGGEGVRPGRDPGTPLVALLAGFRWRRPLMVLLAVAVAGSVALASKRNAPPDEGPASGAMAVVDDRAGLGIGAGGSTAIEGAVSSDAPSEAPVTATGDDGSGRDEVTLQITATTIASSPSRVSDRSTVVRTGDSGRIGEGGSTTSVSQPTVPATASQTTAEASSTTQSTHTVGQSSTTRQTTTTQQTTTTRQTTTTQQITTTEQTTTTRRTTTTVVLVGQSAGGFESPSIGRDMEWLGNGSVGAWRSTNGDIQLMQSGFEGIESVDGGQYAELNSSSQAGLYRDLSVEPGTTIEWEFLHRARSGREELEVRIGPPSDINVVDTIDTTTRWVRYNGRWKVPNGVTSVRFMLWSKVSGPYGNLVDDIRVVARER